MNSRIISSHAVYCRPQYREEEYRLKKGDAITLQGWSLASVDESLKASGPHRDWFRASWITSLRVDGDSRHILHCFQQLVRDDGVS